MWLLQTVQRFKLHEKVLSNSFHCRYSWDYTLDTCKIRKNWVTLNQIGASMETAPRKSFALLAEQTDICVHLRQMSLENRLWSKTKFCELVSARDICYRKRPHNCSISWQTPFHLNGNMNRQIKIKCRYIMLGLVVMCYECNQVYL